MADIVRDGVDDENEVNECMLKSWGGGEETKWDGWIKLEKEKDVRAAGGEACFALDLFHERKIVRPGASSVC